jgi:hypothetical protein
VACNNTTTAAAAKKRPVASEDRSSTAQLAGLHGDDVGGLCNGRPVPLCPRIHCPRYYSPPDTTTCCRHHGRRTVRAVLPSSCPKGRARPFAGDIPKECNADQVPSRVCRDGAGCSIASCAQSVYLLADTDCTCGVPDMTHSISTTNCSSVVITQVRHTSRLLHTLLKAYLCVVCDVSCVSCRVVSCVPFSRLNLGPMCLWAHTR